jgi:pyruvate dehydrogenase (quinone)
VWLQRETTPTNKSEFFLHSLGEDVVMARKYVADLLVDVLAETGVPRIYGVSGDSLNGITDSIRASKRIQWIHVRHEETAAFAAGAEAHLTGRLAVWPAAAVPETCI